MQIAAFCHWEMKSQLLFTQRALRYVLQQCKYWRMVLIS
jgi:hypothetical protein